MIPRFTLPRAVGAVVLAILAIVTFNRVTGAAPDSGLPPPTGVPVLARDLRFQDRADGAVLVLDVADTSGRQLETFEPESGHFVRAMLRSFARERRRADQGGTETPFRLAAWPDGRLTLGDLATGRMVDLGAFGPANAGVFARLLAPGGTP